ncbi:MAG: Esterase depolymerase [Steroidobacteraceae bacterium]|nr:Esterase depolymerase [Steroidobacteraceae bacterium]
MTALKGLRLSAWAAWCALAAASSHAGAPLAEVTDFGSNPGRLRMFVHVPENLPRDAALVVVHGCTQTAQDIADHSGWSDLAVAHGIALVYPQTSRENDSFAGCFRTWLPEHQQRDQGEPLSVMQMVRWMLAHHALDPRKVFVTGLSSGGHLTNVMLATYPDVFQAGAPQSSFPYKCATSFEEVGPCCRGERTHTREDWGALARSGHPAYEGARPRVSIWHGEEDKLLVVSNLAYQRQQWTSALGIDDEPDSTTTVDGYMGQRYEDATHSPRVETFSIPGLGHAVANDPDRTGARCGIAGPYASDVNVCAALWIARWFGIAR